MQIDQAGFDHRPLVDVVDFQDFVHAAHFDDDTTIEGQCSTAQPRAGTPSHEGHAVLVGQLDDGCHLLRSGWKDHRAGQGFVERMAVALIHEQVVRG